MVQYLIIINIITCNAKCNVCIDIHTYYVCIFMCVYVHVCGCQNYIILSPVVTAVSFVIQ